MRCAIIEAETREEVMREMEDRMRNMEAMYSRRLMKEVSVLKDRTPITSLKTMKLEQNEMKTDAKIDMLHQSGLFSSPIKKPQFQHLHRGDRSEERDVEMSLVSGKLGRESPVNTNALRSPMVRMRTTLRGTPDSCPSPHY